MAKLRELLGKKASAVVANSYIATNINRQNGETFKSKKCIRLNRKSNATHRFANAIMNYCLTH